ncbi:hypothetical protein F4859DRAFT_487699 [Xylaria cf. heliscus]|nr:hypothetical protein F4859DRAFT_487699 [Xylaria cf. heliscus]
MFPVNRKATKLRASCDACNESKVRCSQTKPLCERCVRLGISCIYGLSRRSHKTAPRVGALKSRPEKCLPNESSNQNDGSTSSSSKSQCHTKVTSDMASVFTASFQDNVVSPGLLPELDLFARQLVDCDSTDPTAGSDPMFDLINDLSTTRTEGIVVVPETTNLLDHFPPSTVPNAGAGGSRDGLFDSEVYNESRSPVSVSCECNSSVVKQLHSLPLKLEEENGVLDTQFAQLRHAITVVDECIGCACALRDEMVIMTSGILIGRIVEGFEELMTRTNSSSGSPHLRIPGGIDHSPTSSAIPRLRWGGLEIDPDEEAELKHHMWVIQLRKVEEVIKKLGRAIGHSSSSMLSTENSTHLMTCRCLHMWLVQKAERLKKKNQRHGTALANDVAAQQTQWMQETSTDTIFPKDNILQDNGFGV